MLIKAGLHFLSVHVSFRYDPDSDQWSFDVSECNHYNSIEVSYDPDDGLGLSCIEFER